MSTIGGERTAVQNPFLRYAVEAGWTYLSPDDVLFQTLLHNLMTGKVRVHDIPAFAAAGGESGVWASYVNRARRSGLRE